MFVQILVLGFVLSLDNFRASIALGTVPFGLRRAVQIALTFGLWDGVAPLAGILIGRYFHQLAQNEPVGQVVHYAGPALMGAYGVYLLVRAFRTEEPEEIDQPWVLFGIPLSLSLDNFLAGTSLGLVGFPPVASATIFAVITAVMSFAGLFLGRIANRLIRIRSDLLSGIALVGMAVVLALET
jgi:putative Mn2+ efflux pump MntP